MLKRYDFPAAITVYDVNKDEFVTEDEFARRYREGSVNQDEFSEALEAATYYLLEWLDEQEWHLNRYVREDIARDLAAKIPTEHWNGYLRATIFGQPEPEAK